MVTDKPNSVCSVFDAAKRRGKRALEKRPINDMEGALLCDGVANDKEYDVLEAEAAAARALAKLDTIKKDVIWWLSRLPRVY